MPEVGAHPRHIVLLAASYVAYVACVSLVSSHATHERSLFELGFLFGPAIDSVSTTGALPDASRMPLIPYFLGGLARLANSVVFATLAKNLILQTLCARALVGTSRTITTTWMKAAAIGYVLTFPQLVRAAFALVPEEGYLIPLVAYVFWGLLEAKPGASARCFIPHAAALACAFLCKSSVVLLCPAVACLFGWRTRSFAVLAIFLGSVALAALGWGLVNLSQSGHFSFMTSMDGYNFWKGNNPHTLEHFPFRSLDAITHLAPAREAGESEWAWDRRCLAIGLDHDLAHPGELLRLFGWRLYQVFVAVTPEAPAASQLAASSAVRAMGIPHMIIFRLLLWASLAWCARAIWRAIKRRSGPVDAQARRDLEGAVCYPVFLVLFVAPYLVAWGNERRLTPLVLPTVLFAARAFGRSARVVTSPP